MPRALALALLALGACATAAGPPPRLSAQVGKRLALVAADLQGQAVDVGAEQGKVRIVDFWATWCEPCKEELPALDELQHALGPRGLVVYGVSFDEDPAQIPDFLAQVRVRFPILWDKGGDQLSGRYEIQRLPTTLVIDRRGVIRFVHEGWGEARAAEQRRQVERLLDEK